MDEDLAEMAALRKASRFKAHQQTYGDRTEVKLQKRLQTEKRERELENRVRKHREARAAQERQRNAEEGTAVAGDEAAAMAAMGFSAFGKQAKKKSSDSAKEVLEQSSRKRKIELRAKAEEEEKKQRRMEREESAAITGASVEDSDSEDEVRTKWVPQEILEDPYKMPITHEAELSKHSKSVTALTIDPSGARVVTGGLDHMCKFWDFGGMTQELKSFREKEPEENHPIMALSFSPTGSHFLVCTGSVQPKVLDRDGFEKCQFVRGDMYLHDMKYTKGHVAYVTSGAWHPSDKNKVLTASVDGTMRLWDVSQPTQCTQTIKFQPGATRRITVTHTAWSHDGQLIASGGTDGSLRVWSHRQGNKYLRPDKKVMGAHVKGEEITGICFNKEKNMVVSRSTDHTMKAWDLRKMRKPVKVWEGLENMCSQTSVLFDPSDRLLLTGTSNKSGRDKGKIMVYDSKTLDTVQSIAITNQSVTQIKWHPQLNQIFAGCSDGATRILYSPEYSHKGVLLCVGKRPKKKDITDLINYQHVKNPQHLKYFDDGTLSRKSFKSKVRKQDPIVTKMPEKPLEGILGTGGRTYGSTMNQYIARNIVARDIEGASADPREELLKYAAKAEADPMFLGRAYSKTQPEPIFDEAGLEEEDDEIATRVGNARRN